MTLTLWIELVMENLQKKSQKSSPTLWGWYLTKIIFVVSLISMLFSELIVSHRVMFSIETLGGLGENKQFARSKLGIFSQGACINSVKHYLTKYTFLKCRALMNRNFSKVLFSSVLSPFLWVMRKSKLQQLKFRLANLSHCLFQYYLIK